MLKVDVKESCQQFTVSFNNSNQTLKVTPDVGQTVIERNIYQGPYSATVSKEDVVLLTKNLFMKENVTVRLQIPYQEIPNAAGGITVKIGG